MSENLKLLKKKKNIQFFLEKENNISEIKPFK